MTIRRKFYLAFGGVLLMVLLASALFLANILGIQSAFKNLTDRQLRLATLADNIRFYDATLTDGVRAFLIDPENTAAYNQYYDDAAALDAAIQEAKSLALTEEDRQIFENIDKANIELVVIEESLLAEPDLNRAVDLYRTTYGDLKAEYAANVQAFFERQQVALANEIDSVFAKLDQSLALNLVLVIMLVIVSTGSALILSRHITRPLTTLTQVTSSIGQGDLSRRVEIHTHDEIGVLGQTFNEMVDRIWERDNELKELNRSLEKRVEERTIELQKITAVALESARLKSEFLSTMSHELRTPLNAMVGFTGIMLEGMGGEIDDEARHMITRIESNSQRLLGLINQILDLARIEAGRLELVSAPLSPRALADQWQAQISVLAEQKGLAFEVTVDPALPDTLLGDPERLTQIATNLFSNAVKFTEKGRVKLELLQHDETWLIRISDTGAGIPPHALNYIFDEFRQVDGTSKRVYGGSGLGLAIVRSLCLMMKGNVRVTSELGKGSVFTVTLPLITATETLALKTA